MIWADVEQDFPQKFSIFPTIIWNFPLQHRQFDHLTRTKRILHSDVLHITREMSGILEQLTFTLQFFKPHVDWPQFNKQNLVW